MIYLSLVIALALGYVIGLLQNGININTTEKQAPKEYNESIGLDEYTKYYEETGGVNKF